MLNDRATTAQLLTVDLPEMLDMRWASYIIGFSIRGGFRFEGERCELVFKGRWTGYELSSRIGRLEINLSSKKDTLVLVSGQAVGSVTRIQRFGKGDSLYVLRPEGQSDSPECFYRVKVTDVKKEGRCSGVQQEEAWHAPALFLVLLQEKARAAASRG